MLNHEERLTAARSAVDYITSRNEADQQHPVPNCPGWTVYNAASHIGRVAIAWQEMITSTPDDPDSRQRGYDRSGKQPEGTAMSTLGAWAHDALSQLTGSVDRACYFSMTGGEGTVGLWAWHAASELGVHRLDVEAALGDPYSMTHAQALDAVTYTCEYFLPAMRRVLERDPGELKVRLVDGQDDDEDDGGRALLVSDAPGSATIEGPSVEVLLALWGRPHHNVRVGEGDVSIWNAWQVMPSEAFQFGTWD